MDCLFDSFDALQYDICGHETDLGWVGRWVKEDFSWLACENEVLIYFGFYILIQKQLK